MKALLFFIILLIAHKSEAQQYKTFKDSSGASYEIMEFPEMYQVDSCVILAKNNKGWYMPDTSQFRLIQSQWFGRSHTHVKGIISTSDINGFDFLSSTRFQVNDYVAVEMREPIVKLIAFATDDKYYSLILIKPLN